MPDKPVVGIVGASGFIGGRLVEWLALHDFADLRPIVRSFKSMARLARFDLDCRMADATNPIDLEKQLAGCEVLFHCVVGRRDTILRSAEAAYRAAASAGVRRLVYLSSAMVHGPDPAPGTNDDSKLVVRQPFKYNVSKVMAEHMLRRLRVDGTVEVVTLRPSIVFGPHSQLFTLQIAADLLDGKAYLVDEGAGICNSIYVDNLVYAMWQAATITKAANQDFIITDGSRVTWRELYNSVAEAVRVDPTSIPSIKREGLRKRYSEQKYAQLKATGKRFGWAIRESLPSGFTGKVRGMLPSRISNAIKPWWSSLQTPDTSLNQTENNNHILPMIDHEISSWQSCRYMLPIEKARNLLEYEPQVTFSEGCRRTREWLRFASGMCGEQP